jgi:hypothetical protein
VGRLRPPKFGGRSEPTWVPSPPSSLRRSFHRCVPWQVTPPPAAAGWLPLLSGRSPCALQPRLKLLPSTREQIDVRLTQVVVRAPPPSECRPLGLTSKRTSSSSAWGAGLPAAGSRRDARRRSCARCRRKQGQK